MNYYLTIHQVLPEKTTNVSHDLVSILQVILILSDLVSNSAYLFLIIYKCRKWKEKSKDIHSPIFNQLFFVCGLCLLLTDVTILLSTFSCLEGLMDSNTSETTWMLTYVYMQLSQFSFQILNTCVVYLVIMLSFLAALQNIVIIHFPLWRVIVTGKCLTILIIFIWGLLIHFAWTAHYICTSYFPEGLRCADARDEVIVRVYQVVFGVMSFGAALIYYNIFTLIPAIIGKANFPRVHLLYQFVPIFTVEIIYAFIFIIQFVAHKYALDGSWTTVLDVISCFVYPALPAVVSLSYIASRENFRALISACVSPTWREIIS